MTRSLTRVKITSPICSVGESISNKGFGVSAHAQAKTLSSAWKQSSSSLLKNSSFWAQYLNQASLFCSRQFPLVVLEFAPGRYDLADWRRFAVDEIFCVGI